MPDLQQITASGGIDSRRALFAFLCVTEVTGEESEATQKKYASLVKKMPAYVKGNGLGQTLAFYFSKLKEEHSRLLSQAGQYLAMQEVLPAAPDSPRALLEEVIAMDSARYRHTTLELFRWLDWLRRFADGMIDTGGE